MNPSRFFHYWLLISGLLSMSEVFAATGPAKPNIIFILADDLGYGDVGCFQRDCKISTPQIDRLAAEGMRFTDAHTPSAVCSPTRYGLLTGRYAWRTRLQKGVLHGYSPPLIGSNTATLATLLKSNSYTTSVIGKWHLGLDWALKKDARPFGDEVELQGEGWNVDYSKPIAGGPLSHGFDRFFGISASLDMAPFVFIENDTVPVKPEVEKKWIRTGPAAADFEAENVLQQLKGRTIREIESAAAQARQGRPFFIYLALNSPHTPILPSAPWRGRSGLNAYADFVMETDAVVGEIRAAVERLGLGDNTLIVFTSDNGCSPSAGITELVSKGHFPSGPFRGHKADLYEGGNRVPLVVWWRGRVKAGAISQRMVCQTDWMATLADVVEARLDPTAGPDSFSFADEIGSSRTGPLRKSMVMQSSNGSFTFREGSWKFLAAPGSGGWSSPKPGTKEEEGLPPGQLYDLNSDPGERINLFKAKAGRAKAMVAELGKVITDGRSRPGAIGTNEFPVQWNPKLFLR